MTSTGDEQGADRADSSPTGQQQAGVSVGEAAKRLGLTPDAIRGRIRRGTLSAVKRDGEWVIDLPADDRASEQQATDSHDSARQDDIPSNPVADEPPATVDIAPLVQLVDDLTKRNADLAAAAALWQSRAAHLEERLQAIEAGPISPPAPPGAPEATEERQSVDDADHEGFIDADTETPQAGVWERLWRALRGA